MADEDKKQKESLRQTARQQTIGYITTALGLVAGLAWNDAVRTLIEKIYPASGSNGILAKFGYAMIITMAVVLISTSLLRLAESRGGGQTKK